MLGGDKTVGEIINELGLFSTLSLKNTLSLRFILEHIYPCVLPRTLKFLSKARSIEGNVHDISVERIQS